MCKVMCKRIPKICLLIFDKALFYLACNALAADYFLHISVDIWKDWELGPLILALTLIFIFSFNQIMDK